ncbi:PAS domain S-box-containing protein [Bradyrhizobium japonicum]|jgi:PAS domain S-box-containing protein|nr:PAS domain S-box protein [Bradyrhizobium japonicum]MCP1767203.1 PAS domain S-box-containing protein [Bradyrhizobium japonicum]MCP1789342.1 PAS domain S-box-containing protein [Bradyrhizobium japonicum]MCP1801841.1 PAS domain S-box-containing protein [Bradyrhizobium japonicum]MCP1820152.1 PAS domain S-box-containing protein [Bradyrhizobium japonicum]MCP1868340.1 PAS domain S-box-containing protein [Bradyrhizobium japonicum]
MNIQNRAPSGRDDLEPLAPLDARLAATYEHVGAGIVEVDENGRMLRVNQQLCELTGYSAVQLLGRTIFGETHPEDVSEDRDQFQRQLAGEFERYSIEKRIARKDGGHFWAQVTSSSVRDAEGRFLYAVRVQHDITNRKRAEEALARRMEEQAALFAFSERLQHCTSSTDCYEAALNAITRALACERASILLFDEAQIMRFAAWRGLSQGYRQAVEGHSPWTPDAHDPQPIGIEDVAKADLPDALKRTILEEGIQAAAFIPILQDGRLTGKFMAYHRLPHSFSEAEIDVALVLARLLGFSLARLAGEEARRVAERDARQLAAIVESSDDAIVSKNLDGIIQTWNEGAERLFGYRKEEVIGRSIMLLIPKDREGEEADILARIRRGEPIHHYETVRRRKDGGMVDISLTISPIRDRSGRIVGASKIARDITGRKLAEERLRESERRLQELLAAIPAAIYTTDAAGKITYFNQAAVELAGRTPELGTDEWCVTWKLYWPDGTPLPHDQCPMAIALKEGRSVRGVEAVAEKPDGTRVPFIPFPTPLRDAFGNVTGAINMLVDLSERKQAETQQRLLLNELNHRTKNNMQVLQGLLQGASRSARSEEARQVLEEASRRIAAMAAAQRVLYGTTDATRFSAEHFLGAVVETVQQTLPNNVRIERSPATGVLSNDIAMPLALILNELLTNAAKHGIEDPDRNGIRVTLNERDGEYELEVEDDGPGFELSAVQQNSSGLRLVQGLARQLRGEFEVTRAPSRARLRFATTSS